MIAVIDTNILARYTLKDDLLQTAMATQFLTDYNCYVLKTVLLELVWVLTSKRGYALPKDTVLERLRHILSLPSVYVEDLEEVMLALEWYKHGMDFADALHLASSLKRGKNFVTFDQNLSRYASRLKVSQQVLCLSE